MLQADLRTKTLSMLICMTVFAGLASNHIIAAEPANLVSADPAEWTVGTPWTGERGITETVQQIIDRGARDDALAQSRPARIPPKLFPYVPGQGPDSNPLRVPTALLNPGSVLDGQTDEASDLPQTVGTSWNGATLGVTGLIPPDSMGAVGPTQFMVTVNGRVRLYNKVGTISGINVTLDSFFASVLGGSSSSDPQVRYDRTSGRWFVSAITVTAPNRIMIAVSSGSTIVNTGSFTFYFFQNDLVAPAGDTGALADYDSLGVDNNALYIGTNTFNPGLGSAAGFVVRKSSILSGGPIVVTAFRSIWNGATGPYSPRGVDNDDPAATEGYFIGINRPALGSLAIRRITDPGGTPAISGNIILAVPATAQPINVPAMGSTINVDALNDRLFAAAIHKNQITGVRSLWTAHNIQVDAAGNASGVGGRDGSRWYEIGSMTTSPALVQSGTLFDSAAVSPKYYWIPSCAMSGQGHMALGCSYAGAADLIGIAVAGRLRTDALNTIQAPTVAIAGAGTYTVDGGTGRNRWGDYSLTTVDPTDDQTLWTVQEYANGTNSYAVRVIRLNAPPPATPSSCVPGSVTQGDAGVNVTLNGTSASGSEFFDPDATFPNHIAVSVSGVDITVNSVTFVSPTQLTLNLTVSPTAVPGGRTITVTNPDGQVIGSAPNILVVGCTNMGDINRDGNKDGLDCQPFVDCLLSGTAPTGGICPCGDMNLNAVVDDADIPLFAAALGV